MSKEFNKNQLVINPNKPNKIYRVAVINTGEAEECIMLTSINPPTNGMPDNITLDDYEVCKYEDIFEHIAELKSGHNEVVYQNMGYRRQIDTMFDLTENQNHTISILKRKLKRNSIARRLLSGFEVMYFIVMIAWLVFLCIN